MFIFQLLLLLQAIEHMRNVFLLYKKLWELN